MRKLKLLMIPFVAMMVFTMSSLNSYEVAAGTNCTGLTFEAGLQVGRTIGSNETYNHQNFDLYKATMAQYAGCPQYTAGVEEGYNSTRRPPGTPGNLPETGTYDVPTCDNWVKGGCWND